MRRVFFIIFILCCLVFNMVHNSFSFAKQDDKIFFLAMGESDINYQVWSILSNGSGLRKITNCKLSIDSIYGFIKNFIGYRAFSESHARIVRLDTHTGIGRTIISERDKKPNLNIIPSFDQSKYVIRKIMPNGYSLIFKSLDNNSYDKKTVFIQEDFSLLPIQFDQSNSNFLYVLKKHKTISKINILNGVEKEIFHNDDFIINFSISPDNKTIAINYQNENTNKSEIKLLNEKFQPIVTLKSDYSLIEPSFSSDSKHLLYIDGFGEKENRLVFYNIDNHITKIIYDGHCPLATPVFSE